MSYYTSDNSGKESFQAWQRVRFPLLLPIHSPEVCWKHEERGMQLTQQHGYHSQPPPCHVAADLAMPQWPHFKGQSYKPVRCSFFSPVPLILCSLSRPFQGLTQCFLPQLIFLDDRTGRAIFRFC